MMARRLKLAREWVIYLYCLSREGERSVDAGLMASWADLTTYYGAEKMATLTGAICQLSRLCPAPAVAAAPRRDEIARSLCSAALVSGIWPGKWTAMWKTGWYFSEREIQYLAAALQALVDMLQDGARPDQEELITLRMDLYLCQRLISARCPGLSELSLAAGVEHFNQARHMVPIKIGDLVSISDLTEEQPATATKKDHP